MASSPAPFLDPSASTGNTLIVLDPMQEDRIIVIAGKKYVVTYKVKGENQDISEAQALGLEARINELYKNLNNQAQTDFNSVKSKKGSIELRFKTHKFEDITFKKDATQATKSTLLQISDQAKQSKFKTAVKSLEVFETRLASTPLSTAASSPPPPPSSPPDSPYSSDDEEDSDDEGATQTGKPTGTPIPTDLDEDIDDLNSTSAPRPPSSSFIPNSSTFQSQPPSGSSTFFPGSSTGPTVTDDETEDDSFQPPSSSPIHIETMDDDEIVTAPPSFPVKPNTMFSSSNSEVSSSSTSSFSFSSNNSQISTDSTKPSSIRTTFAQGTTPPSPPVWDTTFWDNTSSQGRKRERLQTPSSLSKDPPLPTFSTTPQSLGNSGLITPTMQNKDSFTSTATTPKATKTTISTFYQPTPFISQSKPKIPTTPTYQTFRAPTFASSAQPSPIPIAQLSSFASKADKVTGQEDLEAFFNDLNSSGLTKALIELQKRPNGALVYQSLALAITQVRKKGATHLNQDQIPKGTIETSILNLKIAAAGRDRLKKELLVTHDAILKNFEKNRNKLQDSALSFLKRLNDKYNNGSLIKDETGKDENGARLSITDAHKIYHDHSKLSNPQYIELPYVPKKDKSK
jgi:hypothetical protein